MRDPRCSAKNKTKQTQKCAIVVTTEQLSDLIFIETQRFFLISTYSKSDTLGVALIALGAVWCPAVVWRSIPEIRKDLVSRFTGIVNEGSSQSTIMLMDYRRGYMAVIMFSDRLLTVSIMHERNIWKMLAILATLNIGSMTVEFDSLLAKLVNSISSWLSIFTWIYVLWKNKMRYKLVLGINNKPRLFISELRYTVCFQINLFDLHFINQRSVGNFTEKNYCKISKWY